jgi:hypothetical protein
MALPTKAEVMFKKKKPFLLVIGAAVLLIGGGVAAYWLLVQRKPVLGNAPIGSQLVPQDALLVASITTDPTQWQQLQLYGTPDTKAALDKQLSQLQDTLLTANGYNYEQDVRPWLGKTMMIAYLGTRVPMPGATQKPSSLFGRSLLPDLMVLPVESPTQAQQLFDKTKSQKATQFFERTYKGIQIRETLKSNSQNYSIALLERFLVVTNHPKITERVIDTYKGGSSVAATPGYLEQLPKINAANTAKRFAQLYLNVPVFSALLAANSKRELSAEKIVASQQMQGVTATVTLESQGMRFQGVSWFKPNSTQKYKVENTTTRLPRRLPADTLLMLAGGDIRQLWEDYVQGADSNPLLPIAPDNLNRLFKGFLGLDFENDLLPWMGDEFSLALIPASSEVLPLPENQQSPPLGAGVVLMVSARDRARAEATLRQLDRVMVTRYGFQVGETKLGNQPVVSLTSPYGGISVTHGWLEGSIVFFTLGAPVASAILPEPQLSLLESTLFQQAVPTKPNPNNGQFFLDVERTINSSNLYLPQFLPAEQKLLAKAIRAIGYTRAIQDKQSSRFDLFVQLKTAVIPSPTPLPEIPSPIPGSPSVPQTPSSSPSALQTPRTPSISPSASPTPQPAPSIPSIQQTPQIPSGSPSVSQTPQAVPSQSP